jgi:hypothetical protein
MTAQPVRTPFTSQLHGGFEADHAGMYGSSLRSLCHLRVTKIFLPTFHFAQDNLIGQSCIALATHPVRQ